MFIILDRDGVINQESEQFIKCPDEWIAIPGSLQAIANLKAQGHVVVIATNQSGIGRGLYSHGTLLAIHEKLASELARYDACVDGIFYCPHHPDDQCQCRKPEPGLFWEIGKKFNINLKNAICIGDSLRDIQAAQKVGAKALLVLTGNGEKTARLPDLHNTPIFANLACAVDHLLK